MSIFAVLDAIDEWRRKEEEYRRCNYDPHDYVRKEVETARDAVVLAVNEMIDTRIALANKS